MSNLVNSCFEEGGTEILQCHSRGGIVNMLTTPEKAITIKEVIALVSENTDLDLLHQRMGHLCEQQLKHMVNKGLVTGIKTQKALGLSFCE